MAASFPFPTLRVFTTASLLCVVSACADDGAAPDGGDRDSGAQDTASSDAALPPAADDVPCGVAEIIADNCIRCHASSPAFGAPMPLTSWEALHSPANTDPSRKVYELMADRVHSNDAPMPPAPNERLSEAELTTLDAWIAAGGPVKETEEACNIRPPVMPPTELPCEPSHTILAHADTGPEDPFEVPVDAGNLYQCFAFRSPFAQDEQATAWGPVIDDERVLHHWILYRTQTEQEDGSVMNCNMPSDATFMMGWAPGGGVAVMPDDVGLELKQQEDEWLILQIHYWNTTGIDDSRDRSGLEICTTPTPRTHTAGVFTLGALGINIPARSRDVTVNGSCSSGLTSLLPTPLTVLSSGPHMHELGTRIRTDIVRDGETINMVNVEPWDFNSQTAYWHDPPLQIMPGDTVNTTCVYDNPSDTAVRYGSRTEDEMCFNFAMVYPINIIPAPRACL